LNLGDLIVLVLFVLFVLLPQLNRGKGNQRPLPPGRRAAQPAAPPRGPNGHAAGSPPVSGPLQRERDGPIFSEDPDDDFARRIAEARERVRQAASAAPPAARASVDDASKARASAPLVRDAGSRVGGGTAATAVDPRERARAPLVSSARPGPPARPSVQRGSAAERSRELRREAAPIQVERIPRRASGGGPLRDAPIDLSDWRQGFLWHQVLSAPRARRRLGGGPFPPR